MLVKSIRWRMQLWQAFLLVCILTGFGATAYKLHRTQRFGEIDEDLGRRVAMLSEDVRSSFPLRPPPGPPPIEPEPGFDPGRRMEFGQGFGPPPRRLQEDRGPRLPPENPFEPRDVQLSAKSSSLFSSVEPGDFYYAIWSRSGGLLTRSTNAPPELALPDRADGDVRIRTRTRGVRREAYHFTELGECVLAGRSIRADLDAIGRLAGLLVLAGGAVLMVGLWGGWLLAGRALRPVEAIGAAASRISAGNLAERIDIAETDSELGRLATVLNSTFARLEAAFATQQQFVADASHELRTPIAVLIAEAQATLARPREAGEYRATLDTCLETAQRMRRLTEQLLQLCDLAETARTAVERVRPLASERGIAIECSLTRAEANADPESIGQVAMNLLSNAIRFNRQHGAIRVRSGAESGAAFLSVADTGIGVAEADLEHIFDRFYRGDRARTHASGGTGLGLAISRAIVAAHGGSIAVSSRAGDGSEFVVRLPSATCGVDGRGRGSLSRMPRTPQSAMNDQGDHCTSLG